MSDQGPMNQPPQNRGWQPVFNAPPATMVLCSVLVATYGLFRLLPYAAQDWLVRHFSYIPLLFLSQFSASSPGVTVERTLPLFTHVLFHGDLMHLLVNVGLLLAFGTLAERIMGQGRFLMIFASSAAAGALALTLWSGPSPVVLIGASGGIYGLIGAAVRFMFSTRVASNRRAGMLFVAILMGLNLGMAVLGWGGLGFAAEIAWQAHVGGFLFGLLLTRLFYR